MLKLLNWRSRRKRAMLTCLIATYAVIACKPPGGAPSSTSVSLVFLRSTQDGVEFRLANGTSRVIRIRAAAESFGVVTPWPSEAAIECRDANSTFWYEEPFAFAGGRPELAEVAPGGQVKVVIQSRLTQQHGGGYCRCKLRLEDETIVQTEEFTPHA